MLFISCMRIFPLLNRPELLTFWHRRISRGYRTGRWTECPGCPSFFSWEVAFSLTSCAPSVMLNICRRNKQQRKDGWIIHFRTDVDVIRHLDTLLPLKLYQTEMPMYPCVCTCAFVVKLLWFVFIHLFISRLAGTVTFPDFAAIHQLLNITICFMKTLLTINVMLINWCINRGQ